MAFVSAEASPLYQRKEAPRLGKTVHGME